MPPERLGNLLAEAALRLRAAGCDTPDLDSRLLLQKVTGLTREDLILGPGGAVAPGVAASFRSLVKRREAREPVSRILGEREFYGRVFKVTPDVLDPRPDTETLVDAALKLMPPRARLLDLGTGTGAIAVTLLAERPDATGVAVDLSPAALAVALGNAERIGVSDRLGLLAGSWFAPVGGERFDLIVSNPPYIAQAEIARLAPDVRDHDPQLALAGGGDGLDAYRAIAAEVVGHLAPGGHVLLEVGAGQADDVDRIFRSAGLAATGRHRDLGGHERVLTFGRS